MLKRLTVSALAAPLTLAGCAAADTAAPEYASATDTRSCFFLSQVNGFNDAPDVEPGSDRIIVSVGVNEKYLFETFGSCPDLNWSETIAFDQTGPGQICNGIDVDLIVPTSIGPRRCAVRMIRKLSPAELDTM